VLRVPSSLIDDLVRQCENIVLPCPPNELPALPSLAVTLGTVPDPRRRRGQRYRLAFLLTLAVVAVLGGAKSPAAIAQWALRACTTLWLNVTFDRGCQAARVRASWLKCDVRVLASEVPVSQTSRRMTLRAAATRMVWSRALGRPR
jgi:DDE_Tnp_1-associated